MKKLLLVVFGVVVAGSALAQKMDSFDLHVADLNVLQNRKVQDEIGVTEKMRNKFNAYADAGKKAAQAAAQELQKQKVDPNSKKAQDKLNSIIEDLKQKVMSSLSASQLRRLREITLQEVEDRGLLDPMVAKRIGMTSKESTVVAAAFNKGQKEMSKLLEATLSPVQAKYKTKQPKSQDEADLLQHQYQFEAKQAMEKVKPKTARIKADTEKQIRSAVSAKALAAYKALQGKPSKAVTHD